MFVVGIAQLAAEVDVEAPLLAQDLGLTAYEVRQMLLPGLPAVALFTPERQRALDLLTRLRARGHDALAIDSAAVFPSQEMTALRRFRFEADAAIVEGPRTQRLPFHEISALVRATHRRVFETLDEKKTRKFSAGRAMLSGGLMVTKTKTTLIKGQGEDRQEVLYIFRDGGQTPWLLTEVGTRYDGLGARMAPTERANFVTTCAILRERAPQAVYDERLLKRRVPEKVGQLASGALGQTHGQAGDNAGVDLLAHLIATWLALRVRSAFR